MNKILLSILTLLAMGLTGNFASAQNITGTITCSGVGVPNVVVSDGYVVTTTDENGYYEMTSNKRNRYVFYSVPSGYEPQITWKMEASCKIFPPFYQTLNYLATDKVEVHNFTLKTVNNNTHYLVVGADSHLANRINDLDQFASGYITRMQEEKTNAGTTPVYSTILGDNSWDGYWYSNSFNLSSFKATLTNDKYPFFLFPVMGNHDNDGGTPATDSTDYMASAAWRTTMSPNYYSYNLGKIHYVVLDDIHYLNENTGESYATGIVGSRNYGEYIDTYELDWLKKDLSYIDTSTPIVVMLHCPVWKLNTSSPFAASGKLTQNSPVLLCNILKTYKKVHILSGHIHTNYHAFPAAYPNIHENNIAAVCAIWWWTGYLTGRHNCRDGVPGGYEVYKMDGDSISWQYHSIEENGNAQFHCIDTNVLADFYNSDATIQKMLTTYTSRVNFGNYTSNALLVNVFNYDPEWKVQAFENGTALSVSRVYTEDPFHVLTYDRPYLTNHSTYGTDCACTKNSHMFLVRSNTATGTITVKVTDRFGNVYTQVVERPYAYSVDMKDENVSELVGIQDAKAQVASVYSNGNKLCIESEKDGRAQIVSLNGTVQHIDLHSGHNEISTLQRGIYIVNANGQTKKLFIK